MATYLAAIVFVIVLIRGGIELFHKLKTHGSDQDADRNTWIKYLACAFSGVLFANAVPHFVHGISGEYFPAPFGKYLGRGFAEYLSNVVWGFVNIVLGYRLFVFGGVGSPSKWGKVCFFAGILAMSLFLCFVFSHFKQ